MRNKAHWVDGYCRFPVGFVVFGNDCLALYVIPSEAEESGEVQIIIINAPTAGFSGPSFAPLRMTIGLVIVPCVESRAWGEYEKSSVWVVAGQKKV